MKILHYLLGLPPVRGGGMIKYALDLAEAESETDEVCLLIPGKISIFRKKRSRVKICRAGLWKQIPVYHILNPLPIPMSNGIIDADWYMLPYYGKAYRDFLKFLKPDVIHIHTLMGLHAEFLEAANQLRTAVIYTTHDYFGICLKANMMYHGKVCEHPGQNCIECSKSAFSERRILLEQSKIYTLYRKNTFLVKLFRSTFLKKRFENLRSHQPEMQVLTTEGYSICKWSSAIMEQDEETLIKYQSLLDYYKKMFCSITYFHFNSSMTHRTYEQHLGVLQGEIINISNNTICDRRKKKMISRKFTIGFLGGDIPFKGLKRLQQVMSELYEDGFTNMELRVYGSLERQEYAFSQYYQTYSSDEMEWVFEHMDILAVPSHCMETFGMVVMEAFSFGVPVLITNNVGAQDILLKSKHMLGIIVPDTHDALKSAIRDCYIHRDILKVMNQNILQENINFHYGDHVEEIRIMYRRCMAYQN